LLPAAPPTFRHPGSDPTQHPLLHFCRYAAKAQFVARGTAVVAKTLFECGGFGDPKLGSLTLTLTPGRDPPSFGTLTREVRLNPRLTVPQHLIRTTHPLPPG
jgi:hypothetical protein